jgi:hypothetical protein
MPICARSLLPQVSKAVQDVNVVVNQLSQMPGIKLPLGRSIDIDAQNGEGAQEPPPPAAGCCDSQSLSDGG